MLISMVQPLQEKFSFLKCFVIFAIVGYSICYREMYMWLYKMFVKTTEFIKPDVFKIQ